MADLSVKELSDKLTFAGIEVEGVETVGALLDDNFVVGEVVACERHPNADRLSVCRVSDGAGEWQVVCGAPNVRAGLKVAFAKIGAVVPEGGFVIKRAKLRGVESFGMICSARELQLSEDHEGIMELDVALVAGTLLREVLPAPETVFDLEITWIRSDCLSIIGVAREFAAVLKRELRLPSVDFSEAGEPASSFAKVVVEDTVGCPRYTARILQGIKDGPSPAWMSRRLELCGVRSLGLTVDVTNYVMLECGQPLHAFDYTTLAERTIVVRRARQGEELTTIDGEVRRLDTDMVVIADATRATAIAGVMGGEATEVTGTTSNVLLESATFAAPSIKATATKLGMRSESSHRFERTVDGELADWGSRRATALLVELGGATAAPGVIDIDNRKAEATTVALRFKRARDVIGVELGDDAMVEILERLGFVVTERDGVRGVFKVPSWRCDIELEADLIEEVARMHGLDAIPERAPVAVVSSDNDEPFRARAKCRATLTSLGFTEAMHYSFLSAAELDAFDKRSGAGRLVLPNPVSADYAVMRDSLLPQMVGTLGRNASRQVMSCALFEMGRVFGNSSGHPWEEERVALGILGAVGRGKLDLRRPVKNDEAVLWLRGALEALAVKLHAGRVELRGCEHPAMEKGWAFEIVIDGKMTGVMGAISGALRHQWRLTAPMVVAELQAEVLLANSFARGVLQDVPTFPAVRRDVAFLISESVTHEAIVGCIKKVAPQELTGVEIFDMFNLVESGVVLRSVGYALEFRSTSRTLTDNEVNKAIEKVMQALKDELKVVIRDK